MSCLHLRYILYVSLPTGSVKVERRHQNRRFEIQPSHIKDLKNGNRYTQLSAKLESNINKPERWLSSGRMNGVSKWGIKRTRTLIDNLSL